MRRYSIIHDVGVELRGPPFEALTAYRTYRPSLRIAGSDGPEARYLLRPVIPIGGAPRAASC